MQLHGTPVPTIGVHNSRGLGEGGGGLGGRSKHKFMTQSELLLL